MKPQSADRVTRRVISEGEAVQQLENGSRMDQRTFHALYVRTPEGFKAELIGGIVYVMTSPVSARHGFPHARLIYWLTTYSAATEWTEVGDNTTSILGESSEPQADAFLVIDPACGGATRIDRKGYVIGPPEFVAEVANSSASIDLGAKKKDYETAGVREYVVIQVREKAVSWFTRTAAGVFAELSPDALGVFSSSVFPGLQLSARSFFARRPALLGEELRAGLASPEHAAFVADLAARRQAKPKKPRKSK
ncbi:MAG TPA: Uma2 family endonuclease [Urbifossiella sp.]|jgi:Uma2 family endonuclease|nr:Uma2 family endonuclease [Urbifossiella sp.]